MEVKIIITKDGSDKAETKFAGLNGRNYSLTVGKPIWIPQELYTKVLSKGNLKDRVQVIGQR